MKLNDEMAKVVADIEYCVGKECYNGNSYDGWNQIWGRGFRYPVCLPDENGKDMKIKGEINWWCNLMEVDVKQKNISRMKYKFGSNELYIGKGIENILNYLEERYGLDFNEMEENHIN